MTVLDLTPAPGAAPPAARIARHAKTEAMLLLRNGEQLLLALIIPVAVLVGGRLAGPQIGVDFAVWAPSVLALAVWSTAFTSCAIATGFERRYQVLERLAASPLGRLGLILGKACGLAVIAVGQLVVLSLIAVALGWRPVLTAPALACALLAIPLAAAGFVAAGLALAGTLRAEITLALANVIYLGGLVAGVLPIGGTAWLELTRWLPTGALGSVLRAAGAGQADWLALAMLAVWAVLLNALARRIFRWIS